MLKYYEAVYLSMYCKYLVQQGIFKIQNIYIIQDLRSYNVHVGNSLPLGMFCVDDGITDQENL